jgi:hypothetical protein
LDDLLAEARDAEERYFDERDEPDEWTNILYEFFWLCEKTSAVLKNELWWAEP